MQTKIKDYSFTFLAESFRSPLCQLTRYMMKTMEGKTNMKAKNNSPGDVGTKGLNSGESSKSAESPSPSRTTSSPSSSDESVIRSAKESFSASWGCLNCRAVSGLMARDSRMGGRRQTYWPERDMLYRPNNMGLQEKHILKYNVVSSLWLMTSHKKVCPFSRQAFFLGAHLCNGISAVSYDLYICKLALNIL